MTYPLISIEPGSNLQTFSASSPAGGKIAMFLPSLGGGGAEKSIVRLAAAFDRRGIKVDLVVGTADGPVRDDVPPGVTLVDLGRPRVATALSGLVGYLRRERPAVLFSAMYHANLVAILAHGLARSSSRLVISERQSFVALRQAERSYKERLMRGAMRLLYPRADAVITVSKALAAEITDGLDLAAETIFPVYNPVVSAEMLALAERYEAALKACNPPAFKGKSPIILRGRAAWIKAQPGFSGTIFRSLSFTPWASIRPASGANNDFSTCSRKLRSSR